MNPIIKLSGDSSVILCNKCGEIINYKAFFDKIQQDYPIYCRDCDREEYRKLYKNEDMDNK